MSSERQKARGRRRQLERARRRAWLEAQAPLGWAIILVLAALLGAIYLGQASRTAAMGRHVQTLQIELTNTKRENAALERDIAEAQSLERLQAEALRLGFVAADPAAIEYLVVPNYPALVEGVPAASLAAPAATPLPAPVETMAEALELAVRDNMTNLVRGESREQ